MGVVLAGKVRWRGSMMKPLLCMGPRHVRMGAGNCMGRAWEERASRNHVSGPVCSGAVRLDWSVLKTKQLGFVYQATVGLIFLGLFVGRL